MPPGGASYNPAKQWFSLIQWKGRSGIVPLNERTSHVHPLVAGGAVLILPIKVIGCDRLYLPLYLILQFDTVKCLLHVCDYLCLLKIRRADIPVVDNTAKYKQVTKRNKRKQFVFQVLSIFNWDSLLDYPRQKRVWLSSENWFKDGLIVVLQEIECNSVGDVDGRCGGCEYSINFRWHEGNCGYRCGGGISDTEEGRWVSFYLFQVQSGGGVGAIAETVRLRRGRMSLLDKESTW